MSLLMRLGTILEKGKKLWDNTEPPTSFNMDVYDNYEGVKNSDVTDDQFAINKLMQGDNLQICRYLSMIGYCEKIKMIYVDPPFFSKADYRTDIKLKLGANKPVPVIKQKAYVDSWEDGMEEYLTMLTARLYAFKDLLKEDGSIWIHLDWHAVHYVKVIMDEIFGENNFINEVIWYYKSGGASKRRYSRKHDTLLFYSKNKNYYFKPQKEKSYNRGFKPYRFKGVKEYKDDTGWYTMVNMKDVWQIDMVGRTSAERTGYATQKPEALLQRIIESCTEEGDICADFFGGSGTMAATSEKMGRRWISCDEGKLSTVNTIKRMLENKGAFEFIEVLDPHESIQMCGDGIDVDIYAEKILSSDSDHMTVKVTGYKLWEEAYIPVESKYMPYIEDIEKNDWLQLIDYFAVDFNYNGKVFRPNLYSVKLNEYIEPQVENIITQSGNIAVKVIDIFGNVRFKVI